MTLEVKPKLASILKERELTQMGLSAMSGVSQAVISGFDRAIRHNDAHLFAIARALELNVEQLFEVNEK